MYPPSTSEWNIILNLFPLYMRWLSHFTFLCSPVIFFFWRLCEQPFDFLWLSGHLLGKKSHFEPNIFIFLSKFWADLGKTFPELSSHLVTTWNISGRMLMLREDTGYMIWTKFVIPVKILGSWDTFPIEHLKSTSSF